MQRTAFGPVVVSYSAATNARGQGQLPQPSWPLLRARRRSAIVREGSY